MLLKLLSFGIPKLLVLAEEESLPSIPGSSVSAFIEPASSCVGSLSFEEKSTEENTTVLSVVKHRCIMYQK